MFYLRWWITALLSGVKMIWNHALLQCGSRVEPSVNVKTMLRWMSHTLMNSWFPEGPERFVLPGDRAEAFVWWHRNKSLCWTTTGIMRRWRQHGKLMGLSGGRRRRCEARAEPHIEKETRKWKWSERAAYFQWSSPAVSSSDGWRTTSRMKWRAARCSQSNNHGVTWFYFLHWLHVLCQTFSKTHPSYQHFIFCHWYRQDQIVKHLWKSMWKPFESWYTCLYFHVLLLRYFRANAYFSRNVSWLLYFMVILLSDFIWLSSNVTLWPTVSWFTDE